MKKIQVLLTSVASVFGCFGIDCYGESWPPTKERTKYTHARETRWTSNASELIAI